MQKLGVVPSFSRPAVSDDNPYSEALFRTPKYCPYFSSKPFSDLDEAKLWLIRFVDWYNNHRLHSAIKFATPANRHAGPDSLILQNRKVVYQIVKGINSIRWSGKIRDWEPITKVYLNPLKSNAGGAMKIAA